MILQSLAAHYDRLAATSSSGIPRFGFSRENISWAIVLERNGKLNMIRDLRHDVTVMKKSKQTVKKVPQTMNVPSLTSNASRSGKNPPPNFLWDNSSFVLGTKSKPGDRENYFQSFRKYHHSLGDTLDDEGMEALLKFLDHWNCSRAGQFENLKDMLSGNYVFRLTDDRQFIHERPAIMKFWQERAYEAEIEYARDKNNNAYETHCLISGDRSPVARIHRQIHGIREPDGFRPAQSTGGSIIGFQGAKVAFSSYGMDGRQSFNAPVSIRSAFAYTTALNWLLRADSDRKMQIADATTVFWAERPSLMEPAFHELFNPSAKESKREGENAGEEPFQEDTESAVELKSYLDAVRQGKWDEFEPEKDVRFYILGLSPNAARIAIRFWHMSTVADIAEKIGRHFSDIAIEDERKHRDHPRHPGMWQLLRETAVKRDIKNVPPLIGGELMRSILTGGKYPSSLLARLIERLRHEHDTYNELYFRMSLIKGCLVRNYTMEVPMSLDPSKTDIPYLLGRLFAVFERAQEDAAGGQLNATIKDKYFGSASATPRSVFPVLMKLNSHHTSKGEHGGYYMRLASDIIEHLPAEHLPTHLPLQDQGLFAIGYYHQRNDLFKPRKAKNAE